MQTSPQPRQGCKKSGSAAKARKPSDVLPKHRPCGAVTPQAQGRYTLTGLTQNQA